MIFCKPATDKTTCREATPLTMGNTMSVNSSQALVISIKQELAELGVKYNKVEALATLGWTAPMVREAADIARVENVQLGYIARLNKRGIALPVIAELVEARKNHPDLSIPALNRAWELCMSERGMTEDHKKFFLEFLDACEELFNEAAERFTSRVARQPSFVFSRLIQYVTTAAERNLEAVHQEMLDDSKSLLDRIMEFGQRGIGHRTLRGNPYGYDVDLTELVDEDNDR